ncbi:hypothetical protein NDU88_002836 [Pleurodeles waltl]|uniref:Secreted protein n=1 Tax=Pleurodeles waltl TaxID=8319 RepID=A0AAV7LGW1_PLEWA|nr:hypothetical protein NDU88_002836 [Pleurodeles waltl]
MRRPWPAARLGTVLRWLLRTPLFSAVRPLLLTPWGSPRPLGCRYLYSRAAGCCTQCSQPAARPGTALCGSSPHLFALPYARCFSLREISSGPQSVGIAKLGRLGVPRGDHGPQPALVWPSVRLFSLPCVCCFRSLGCRNLFLWGRVVPQQDICP